MILLGSSELTQGSKVEPIINWKVVFFTIQGMCETLEEANQICEKLGIDSMTIRPMVLAESETIRELCIS